MRSIPQVSGIFCTLILNLLKALTKFGHVSPRVDVDDKQFNSHKLQEILQGEFSPVTFGQLFFDPSAHYRMKNWVSVVPFDPETGSFDWLDVLVLLVFEFRQPVVAVQQPDDEFQKDTSQ